MINKDESGYYSLSRGGRRSVTDKIIQVQVGVRMSMINNMIGNKGKTLKEKKKLVQEIIRNQLKAKFGDSSTDSPS